MIRMLFTSTDYGSGANSRVSDVRQDAINLVVSALLCRPGGLARMGSGHRSLDVCLVCISTACSDKAETIRVFIVARATRRPAAGRARQQQHRNPPLHRATTRKAASVGSIEIGFVPHKRSESICLLIGRPSSNASTAHTFPAHPARPTPAPHLRAPVPPQAAPLKALPALPALLAHRLCAGPVAGGSSRRARAPLTPPSAGSSTLEL
jgi:hypothetical protein